MIDCAPRARLKSGKKTGADLWQSGQHRQISHTRD
jgi:hypothetical protein